MVRFSISLPDDQAAALRRNAARHDRSAAAELRRAVRIYLRELERASTPAPAVSSAGTPVPTPAP